MKEISTVGMNGVEKQKLLGNLLGSVGNENIRGHHIKYFEEKIVSENEESCNDVATAPNYYAWLCLISEHVFWLMRHFCFRQDDLSGDDLSLQYNDIVTAFCDKCRELNLFLENDLKELYGLMVKVLYLRHALVHNGFPNLLPAGCETLQVRNMPFFSKTQNSPLKFTEDEAREIVSWYSKPGNFRRAKEDFRRITNATCKGPGLSVGF